MKKACTYFAISQCFITIVTILAGISACGSGGYKRGNRGEEMKYVQGVPYYKIQQVGNDSLQELERQLVLVRKYSGGSHDAVVQADGVRNVDFMIQYRKPKISAALGTPDVCVTEMDENGTPSEAYEDCSTARIWKYHFYRLPKRFRGGGRVLRLSFGDDGTCLSASWYQTQ